MLPLRPSSSTMLARSIARTGIRQPLVPMYRGIVTQRSPSRPTAPPQRVISASELQRLVQLRHASTRIGGGQGIKISHLFGGLVGLGMLVTIYGLLEWYYTLQTWPEPIKTPLKKALKARNQKDWDKSDKYFRDAIAATKAIHPTSLEPDPLEKLSGIYITYAAMLEQGAGQPIRAFVALRQAFDLFGADPLAANPPKLAPESWIAAGDENGYTLTELDQTRAIGLAQKLGQIAARMGSMASPPPFPRPEDGEAGAIARGGSGGYGAAAGKEWDAAAESYLSPAVAAMLRIGLSAGPRAADAKGPVVAGRDLALPHDPAEGAKRAEESATEQESGRVNRRGLGITMETLAEVYARQGQPALAGHLLIQAVSTLLPPQSEELPPLADRCQAAMLMTAISSHALAPATEQAFRASKSWSLRALQIVDEASKEAGWGTGAPADVAAATCARAKSVGLYNLGALAEMQGQKAEAARNFGASLQVAREAGFGDGKRQAVEAIRRVRAAESE